MIFVDRLETVEYPNVLGILMNMVDRVTVNIYVTFNNAIIEDRERPSYVVQNT